MQEAYGIAHYFPSDSIPPVYSDPGDHDPAPGSHTDRPRPRRRVSVFGRALSVLVSRFCGYRRRGRDACSHARSAWSTNPALPTCPRHIMDYSPRWCAYERRRLTSAHDHTQSTCPSLCVELASYAAPVGRDSSYPPHVNLPPAPAPTRGTREAPNPTATTTTINNNTPALRSVRRSSCAWHSPARPPSRRRHRPRPLPQALPRRCRCRCRRRRRSRAGPVRGEGRGRDRWEGRKVRDGVGERKGDIETRPTTDAAHARIARASPALTSSSSSKRRSS